MVQALRDDLPSGNGHLEVGLIALHKGGVGENGQHGRVRGDVLRRKKGFTSVELVVLCFGRGVLLWVVGL